MSEYVPAMMLVLLAALTSAGIILLSAFVGPKHKLKEKMEPFECGETPLVSPRIRFDIKFYLVAMLFVIFDIEAVFLYPWGILFRELGLAGLIQMGVFLSILAGALIYIWKRGALDWE